MSGRVEPVEQRNAREHEQRDDHVLGALEGGVERGRGGHRARDDDGERDVDPERRAEGLVLAALRAGDDAAHALGAARDDDVVDRVRDDERLREPAEVAEPHREAQQRLLDEADDEEEELGAEHGDAPAPRRTRVAVLGSLRVELRVVHLSRRAQEAGSSDRPRPGHAL